MIVLMLLGCRPDPGAPSYPARDPWVLTEDDGFYEDVPEDGEERLSYGIFYEGAAEEALVVDDVENHFYIYSDTFTVTATDDRWEGYSADLFTHNGVGWWGGGIHWDVPRDISGWDTLHVVVRTAALTGWTIGLTGGGAEARVSVEPLGMVADDTWHVLEIPLSTFDDLGADLTAVTVGLLFIGEGGSAGDTLMMDGLYLSRVRP